MAGRRPGTPVSRAGVAVGRVWIDDEDEFAEHQVSLGDPPDVVAAAERSCAELHRWVCDARPPFDGPTAARWFAALALS